MKCRKINNEEIRTVKNLLSRYIGKSVETLPFDNVLVVGNDLKRLQYVSDDILKNMFENELSYKVTSMGINLGVLIIKNDKEKFSPSVECLNLISKYVTKNYVVLNGKGEEMFLYAKDAFESSFEEISGEGKLVVFNKNRELIGMGNYNGEILVNLMDKGWYLRNGG
ncbi:60S ribosome subunit biogenesis protein NIP7 [Methanococcus voltae]|uniref:NIP7 pre-PUA domain-containing protein n=1 Tax=Methanococcus voltae TaxID=2188 RepID=UPI001AE0F4F1|nr:NIP7 N-terminal domain-related protein [Methanococcus voltae]MBP2144300.1 60S ribosome subunit biogenesis protein NIP7 [Methanococcus voltae]